MRRNALVAAVALFAVFAGCSGGSPDAAGTTPGSADAATPGTTGPPATERGPPLAEQSWTNDTSVAFRALFERHRAVVSNATSIERVYVVEGGDTSMSTRVAVDREARRLNATIRVTRSGTERVEAVFVANATAYSKSGTPGDFRYARRENAVTRAQFPRLAREQTGLRLTPGVLAQWNFEYVGFEGGAYRFEADSVTPAETGRGLRFDLANVTETTATLVVDERGFVRRIHLAMTVKRNGEATRVRLTSAFSGVNETTVDAPPWTKKTGVE